MAFNITDGDLLEVVKATLRATVEKHVGGPLSAPRSEKPEALRLMLKQVGQNVLEQIETEVKPSDKLPKNGSDGAMVRKPLGIVDGNRSVSQLPLSNDILAKAQVTESEARLEEEATKLQMEVDTLVARVTDHRMHAPKRILAQAQGHMRALRPAGDLAEEGGSAEDIVERKRKSEDRTPDEDGSLEQRLDARLAAVKRAYISLYSRIQEAIPKMSRIIDAAEKQQGRTKLSYVEQVIAEHDEANGYAGCAPGPVPGSAEIEGNGHCEAAARDMDEDNVRNTDGSGPYDTIESRDKLQRPSGDVRDGGDPEKTWKGRHANDLSRNKESDSGSDGRHGSHETQVVSQDGNILARALMNRSLPVKF